MTATAGSNPSAAAASSRDLDGFNLHAAVPIEADDNEWRERLVRYCARPCFALERLRVLPEGRVAYRITHAGRRGAHRVMTPVELRARLAALVAPSAPVSQLGSYVDSPRVASGHIADA